MQNSLKKLWVFLSTKPKTKLIAVGTIILLLIIAVPLTVYLSQTRQDLRQRASQTTTSPAITPIIITMFGQKKITETSQNATTGKGLAHAAGVIVDRSSSPNKLYVVDTAEDEIHR